MKIYEAERIRDEDQPRFGSARCIEARDLLRVYADCNVLQCVLSAQGYRTKDLPNNGQVFGRWDIDELEQHRTLLRIFAGEIGNVELDQMLDHMQEAA